MGRGFVFRAGAPSHRYRIARWRFAEEKESPMIQIAVLRLWIAASIMFLIALAASPAAARTWTDQRGRTISGKFVRLDGDKVVILSAGKVVSPRLSSLSQADQNYVRDM